MKLHMRAKRSLAVILLIGLAMAHANDEWPQFKYDWGE